MSDPAFPLGAEPALTGPGGLRCRRIVDLETGAVWGVEVASRSAAGSLVERAIEAVHPIQAIVGVDAIVSVDMSTRQLQRESFVSEFAAMLRAASVDPSAMMLEIAEGPRRSEHDTLVRNLVQLHELGVRLALDDFGAGFASLASLKRMPLDVVKVSRSLVDAMPDDDQAVDLVSAIARLVSMVGLELVATGVETASHAEALREAGCRLVQGPMFPEVQRSRSRPASRAPAASPPASEPPLSIEPITGWRVWSLHEVDGELRIGAITRPATWPARQAMRAVCDVGGHDGRSPDEGCVCGIYATSSPEYLARSGALSTSACVVGAIAMWGRVIEHTHGARSEFAYPARLRLACVSCLQDGRGAVVPSVVVGTGSAMAAYCRWHAVGRPGTRRKASQVEAALRAVYGVDLLPIERVKTLLRFPRGPRRRRRASSALESVAEGAFMVLGVVINIVMTLWVASAFLFFAAWIVGAIVGVVTGNG